MVKNEIEGAPAVHPRMILKILFYSYAKGVYSSREMEDRMRWDPNYIYRSANQRVDHSTILTELEQEETEPKGRISFLGVNGQATALFNIGPILTGMLSLIFAFGLRKSLLPSRLAYWGANSLILGSMAFSAIGIFPQSIDLPHNLASVLFFVFFVLALLLIDVAFINTSGKRWGLLSLIATVLIIAFRLVPWPWSDGSIPQLLHCLPWSLWTIAFRIRLLCGVRQINFKPDDLVQQVSS